MTSPDIDLHGQIEYDVNWLSFECSRLETPLLQCLYVRRTQPRRRTVAKYFDGACATVLTDNHFKNEWTSNLHTNGKWRINPANHNWGAHIIADSKRRCGRCGRNCHVLRRTGTLKVLANTLGLLLSETRDEHENPNCRENTHAHFDA
jgi:hypothetical protein